MYARIDSSTQALELLGDAELVRRLKLGRDEALDVLLQRHREPLYRFCCHLMGSREDAEDVCQETLARAITRVDSLQAGSAFRSWLFSIARNLSVDSFRSKKKTCPMPDEEAMPLPLYGETPHDRIETSEEHQTVAEALGKLTQSHQRVLVLREVDGLSYAAIAEEMQVSQSAVETLLFRARRRLREEYSKSAVPVVAMLNGLRDLATRLAGPIASGPVVAKLAVTTALVGTGAATTGQIAPFGAHVLHRAPIHRVVARHHSVPAVHHGQRVAAAPVAYRLAVPARHSAVPTMHLQAAKLPVVHHTRWAIRHARPAMPPGPPHGTHHLRASTKAPPAPPQVSVPRVPASTAPHAFAPSGATLPVAPSQSNPSTVPSGPKTQGAPAPHVMRPSAPAPPAPTASPAPTSAPSSPQTSQPVTGVFAPQSPSAQPTPTAQPSTGHFH
jgi:RNA polymerase sigma factor (sigma-70 family)